MSGKVIAQKMVWWSLFFFFFFEISKSKIFYCYDKVFKSFGQLKKDIVNYIDYYDNKSIKVKLSSQGTYHQTWEPLC